MRIHTFLLLLGVVGVACGGTTVGAKADGGSDAGCTDKTLPGKRACVIGRAKAKAALTLEADADGCLGCGSSLLPCNVHVSGRTITLGLRVRECPIPPGVGCPICQLPKSKCEIPPLSAGTYEVVVDGAPVSPPGARRTLVVEDGATDTSCELGFGPTKPVSAADFPRDCTTPDDCALVVEGDGCSVCACPTGAVAKAALADYEAALREAASQCEPGGTKPCPRCLPHEAACVEGKCQAVPK